MDSAEGYSYLSSCCHIDLMMLALMLTLYVVTVTKQILIASLLILFLCISGTSGVIFLLPRGFTMSVELAMDGEGNSSEPSRSHLTQQHWAWRGDLQNDLSFLGSRKNSQSLDSIPTGCAALAIRGAPCLPMKVIMK